MYFANANFDQILLINDKEAATNTFTWLFNSVLDLHAPIKTIQNRKHYVPYITPEISNLMTQRNNYKKMTSQSDDPAIEAQYKLVKV